MFSGLEAQSEINQLLDEIYGGLAQASRDQARQCSRAPETDQRQEGVALCTSPRQSARGRRVIEIQGPILGGRGREGRDEGG